MGGGRGATNFLCCQEGGQYWATVLRRCRASSGKKTLGNGMGSLVTHLVGWEVGFVQLKRFPIFSISRKEQPADVLKNASTNGGA